MPFMTKKNRNTQDKITECFPSFSKPALSFRETLSKWKNVLDQIIEKGPGNKPENFQNYKDYKRSKSDKKEKKEMDQEYKMQTRAYKKKKYLTKEHLFKKINFLKNKLINSFIIFVLIHFFYFCYMTPMICYMSTIIF